METMNIRNRIADIQAILGITQDSAWGPNSNEALSHFAAVHRGIASSFADPADIRAFTECKAQGKTDQQCFAMGDNGIGKWGGSTAKGFGPCCALPPEDWEWWEKNGDDAAGQLVVVTYGKRSIICDLRDSMPRKANITNGAIIDLNPDACDALGINVPALVSGIQWRWL